MKRLHTIAQTIIEKLEAQELIEALVRLADDPSEFNMAVTLFTLQSCDGAWRS